MHRHPFPGYQHGFFSQPAAFLHHRLLQYTGPGGAHIRQKHFGQLGKSLCHFLFSTEHTAGCFAANPTQQCIVLINHHRCKAHVLGHQPTHPLHKRTGVTQPRQDCFRYDRAFLFVPVIVGITVRRGAPDPRQPLCHIMQQQRPSKGKFPWALIHGRQNMFPYIITMKPDILWQARKVNQFRQHIHKGFAALLPHPALHICQPAGKKQGQSFAGRFAQQHFIQFRFHPFQRKIAAPADIKDVTLLQIIFCAGLAERQSFGFFDSAQYIVPQQTILSRNAPCPVVLQRPVSCRTILQYTLSPTDCRAVGQLGVRSHGLHVCRNDFPGFFHGNSQILFHCQAFIILAQHIVCRIVSFHVRKIQLRHKTAGTVHTQCIFRKTLPWITYRTQQFCLKVLLPAIIIK